MSRTLVIRLTALLAILAFSAQPAFCQRGARPAGGMPAPGGMSHQQFSRGFFPSGFFPFFGSPFFPYGGYGWPFGGYGGPYGGYGGPSGGYGSPYGGYGAYGGMYAPDNFLGGYGGYSAPSVVIVTATSPSGGPRSTLWPATAVPDDASVLLAAWCEPTGDSRAAVVIQVPDAQAKIWVENSVTSQWGRIRRFISPPLAEGKGYKYEIRAQWFDADGRVKGYTQEVQVRAGEVVNVVFAE
jgi:uncharacterized protein (TIGR03000 family)